MRGNCLANSLSQGFLLELIDTAEAAWLFTSWKLIGQVQQMIKAASPGTSCYPPAPFIFSFSNDLIWSEWFRENCAVLLVFWFQQSLAGCWHCLGSGCFWAQKKHDTDSRALTIISSPMKILFIFFFFPPHLKLRRATVGVGKKPKRVHVAFSSLLQYHNLRMSERV